MRHENHYTDEVEYSHYYAGYAEKLQQGKNVDFHNTLVSLDPRGPPIELHSLLGLRGYKQKVS